MTRGITAKSVGSLCHGLLPVYFFSCCPQIDFVAHDDIPYTSAGSEDVYKHIKEAGKDFNSIQSVHL